jgi:hypothetical protein
VKSLLTSCFCALILVVGCEVDPPIQSNCDKVVVLSKWDYDNGPRDEFWLDTIVLAGNCLKPTYQYGGGCGTSEMHLYDYDDFTDNTLDLPKRMLRFAFKDMDNCEALIKTSVSFDLTPLQKNNASPLRLQIEGWNEILYYYF